jgi:hypothetical protein
MLNLIKYVTFLIIGIQSFLIISVPINNQSAFEMQKNEYIVKHGLLDYKELYILDLGAAVNQFKDSIIEVVLHMLYKNVNKELSENFYPKELELFARKQKLSVDKNLTIVDYQNKSYNCKSNSNFSPQNDKNEIIGTLKITYKKDVPPSEETIRKYCETREKSINPSIFDNCTKLEKYLAKKNVLKNIHIKAFLKSFYEEIKNSIKNLEKDIKLTENIEREIQILLEYQEESLRIIETMMQTQPILRMLFVSIYEHKSINEDQCIRSKTVKEINVLIKNAIEEIIGKNLVEDAANYINKYSYLIDKGNNLKEELENNAKKLNIELLDLSKRIE